MKKKHIVLLSILAAIVLLVVLAANVHRFLIPQSAPVTIEFHYDYTDTHFKQQLTPEESARIIEILKGGYTSFNLIGTPSCGFRSDIAIEVGTLRLLPANDTCNWLACGSTFQMLNVSEEEMAEIHAIFENYGGFFPCT